MTLLLLLYVVINFLLNARDREMDSAALEDGIHQGLEDSHR